MAEAARSPARCRWSIDCAGARWWTAPATLAEAQALADRKFPPPAPLKLVGIGTWRRHGGEPNDGGGCQPIEWVNLSDEGTP